MKNKIFSTRNINRSDIQNTFPKADSCAFEIAEENGVKFYNTLDLDVVIEQANWDIEDGKDVEANKLLAAEALAFKSWFKKNKVDGVLF